MPKRSPSTKRAKQPISPTFPIIVVKNGSLITLMPEMIRPANVGLKAFGLASIPAVWTKPFFVVSETLEPIQSAIEKAAINCGMSLNTRILLRSSGVNESLDHRGALISTECSVANIAVEIKRLQSDRDPNVGPLSAVHWVVQSLLTNMAKGHLSNERRLSLQLRDWVVEAEVNSQYGAESHKIALRPWRNSLNQDPRPLLCEYRLDYVACLKEVAKWAYERQIRVHFEWVWDGQAVYIVQADDCELFRMGSIPKDLVATMPKKNVSGQLKTFRLATSSDFNSYKKLANARLYQQLGYTPVNFFVLDDETEISKILNGDCSDELAFDLAQLTGRPLVMRTDGKNIPLNSKEMLPRSDELRTPEAAKNWLLGKFKDEILRLDLANCEVCLIAHHFIPATASAWCQAHPNERRVRIESIWGIPEGLYWYAYDVFDVDTLVTNPEEVQFPPGMRIRERLRFKERFIAPDNEGAWVLHKTASGPDWSRSIRKTEWVNEIAWASRRIAKAIGKSVVVMWFIDIPRAFSPHRVVPWFHTEWKDASSPFKAAPRKKIASSGEFLLKTTADWHQLKREASKGRFSRVVIIPEEPDIVRNQEFAKEVAELAKENHFVVELSGGVLSHAYYMLSRSGCDVECVDLDEYATEDDEVKFNKLVRDKIPGQIAARGENVAVFKLDGEALISALRRKLVEEALEVVDAQTTAEIIEELADVREVMHALASKLGITEDAIQKARNEKKKKRGAFEDAFMLTKTVLTSSLKAKNNDSLGNLYIPAEDDYQRITAIEDMPSTVPEVHVDKRQDSNGIRERQLTVTLPAYSATYRPPKGNFSFETSLGEPHDMTFEISLDRDGSDLKCRLRLINSAIHTQMNLFEEER